MTNKKSTGKKVLSILLSLLMCLSLVPVMSEIAPEVEAATAGLYDIKVEVTVTNGADGWDQNDHYVNHKANNGTGNQTAQSVGLSTGNMDEEKTHTFTYTSKGFPTSYTYNYSFGGGLTWRKLEFTLKVYASKAGANSWKEVMSGSFSDESSAFSAAKGTWTVNASTNIAAPASISWTNTAKSITVPKSGTATAATLAATVYDQYGVEWYQEPYYALNSSSTATSTTETISGITRTTSQANTCTVSVTNAAKTWVDNGGGTSRDVYVTAYINSVKSTTTKFTINQVQYNIKFYNEGTLMNSETANQLFYYNDRPYINGNPSKDADAQYTYVFDGWNTSNANTTTGSPAYTNSTLPVANADASYYAHYSAVTNEYEVTFKNYDGTVLQTSKVPYGDVPLYDGATPVKPSTPEYSYTFTGWDPQVSEVTGEVTYTAVYSETKNKYAVEFRNENGDTLDVQYLEYGATPVYGGATPSKDATAQYSYVFSGWTPEIEAVTTQALYTAKFDAVLNSYDVIFKNEDGTILQNSKYNYGEMPVYGGATPEKAATPEYTYTFAGWTPGVVNVTGNAEYTAVYSSAANEYKVYYKNYDGSALSEEKVKYGEAAQMASALAPEKPASNGKTYVFAGWSAELNSITKDTYAVAQYAVEGVENYWVTFVDTDGTVLYKTMVEEGGTAVYGIANPVKEGYTFAGWDKALSNITADTTVTALYSKEGEQYVVTYVDWDDTFIASMIVNHGENAVAPEAPSREGDENTVYTFTGWDNNGENVTSNLVIKATYDVHTHDYNTFVENVIPATCVSNRTDKFSCSCGLTKDIEVENSFDDNHVGPLTLTGEKAVSCTENGYTGDMVCDTCKKVAKYGETITASGHKEEEIPAVEATCTSTGLTAGVKCSVCGETLVSQTVVDKKAHTEEEIPAVAPTCTEDGLKAGVKCSVCDEVLTAQETDPKLGHDMGEFVETIPATCTSEGEERADCSRCDYYETQKIAKKAHTEEEIPAVAPTCTEDGLTAGVKCSVCGEVLTAQETDPKLGHDMGEFVVTTPATCTEEGEERADCSRCDYFETREIEKKAHTEETIPAVEATCTSTGLTAGAKCSVCGETLVSQTVVDKKAHTEEEIPAVAPTCTEDGLKAGVKCSVCDEVLKAQETDPKLGHDMGAFVVTTEATCTAEGEERADCSRCDYFETREIEKKEHTEEEIPAVAPTCTEDGLKAGVKCSVCDEVLTAQETDPKLGHDMGEFTVTTPATCTAEGEERSDCSRCDYYETREIEKKAHTEEEIPAVAPTCTEDGLTAGVKCSVCGEVLTAQETDPKLGHDMGEFVVTTEATCTAEGEERADCSRCDYFETREIEKKAHTEETIPAVEATCTSTGLTAGVKCSVCGNILVAQTTVEKKAHTEEEIPAVAPTCTEDGLKAGVKCSVCGEVLTAQETDPKLGHDMGAFTETKAPSCTEKGEERADCSRCDYFETREIEKKEHTEETIPAVEATCTSTGLTAGVKCSVCGEILVEQTETAKAAHTEEEIPAVAPDCENDGLTVGVKCSVCGEVLTAQETDPKLGHDMSDYTEITAPTCTTEGEGRTDCSRCDYYETKIIEKASHSWADADCTKPSTCTVCGETSGTAIGHDMGEFIVTTPATCTEEGEERSDCSRCDYYETNVIEKADHTEEEIPAVAPDCLTDGLTAGVKCAVCGEVLTAQETDPKLGHDMGEFTVTTPSTCTTVGEERSDCSRCDYYETKTIEKAAHTEEEIPAVAPTCTEDGLTAGVKCSVCGEVLTAQETDPKLGHDMGEFVVTTPATCTAEGEERADCSRCDYFETREIEKKAHTEEEIPAVAPTCTEDGLTAGIKCSVCGEVLKAQETDPKLGHDMGEFVVTTPATCTAEGEERSDCSRCDYYETQTIAKADHAEEEIPAVEATCTSTGLTAGVKCSVCGDILVAQTTVEKKAHTEEEIPAVAPDCTNDGLTAGVKCSVCGEVLTAQEAEPALGHDMSEFVETIPATCTSEGEERADCSRCDYFETQTIEKKAHTEEEIPAVDATCTSTGLTEGVKCSVCGEILVAQTETAKLSHDMGEFAVTKEATCSEAGEERADCANCDYYETKVIAKKAHTEETVSGKAPTCTEKGLTDGVKCSVCGETITAQKEISAKGHKLGEWKEVKAPTCTEKGLEEAECSECDYVKTRETDTTDHNYDENGVCKDCNAQHKCMHICHRQHNIFARIVWTIIRGICSIFGLAKTCSCGAAHY